MIKEHCCSPFGISIRAAFFNSKNKLPEGMIKNEKSEITG